MRSFSATVLAIASLMAVSTGGDAGDKKSKDKTDGTWILVAMEQDGKKVPADAIEKLKMKLIIKGENYTITMDGKQIDKGTSKVDEKKKPITVDIKSEEGPNKDKTILAIVEFEGDTMKSCYNLEGTSRPTEFSTKEGSGNVLILYKREAKKKGE